MVELVAEYERVFLNRRLADLDMELMLELVREIGCGDGRECEWGLLSLWNIDMPHKAQHILTFALDVCADTDSCKRLVDGIGSD